MSRLQQPRRRSSRFAAAAVPAELVGDRRRLRGARSRRAILSRAISVASIGGLSGITLGSLADDLGIGKSNIMVLFKNKQALQIATLDAAVDVFVSVVVTPALGAKSALSRLVSFCDGWFEYVSRRTLPGGCMMYATVSEFRTRPGPICERAMFHFARWEKLLQATLDEAKQAAEIQADCRVREVVIELMAFQAIANLSALLGDRTSFACAQRCSRERIGAIATAACYKGTSSTTRLGHEKHRRRL